MKYVYGMDIGGTKCATIISRLDKDEITFLARREFPTASTPEEVIDHMINDLKEEALMLNRMHKEKIKLSDAILVVYVNGYIGDGTNSEIEYAKSLNKEIIYYTDLA